MNESFVFYRSFADALEKLPAEQFKEIMTALCQYALDGTVPELSDPMLEAIFLLIRPQIDANAKRRESGKKGAESRWSDGKPMANDGKGMANDSKPMAPSCDPIPNANANVNANVNANAKHTPPTPSHGDDGSVSDHPEKGTAAEKTDRLFEVFWLVYPKKVGKGDARKAFGKIRPSEKLVGMMIAAVKRQSASFQWTKDHGKYIPNPATWLNQQRWLDEVEPDMGRPDPTQHPPNRTRFHNLEERDDDIDADAVALSMRWLKGGGDGGGGGDDG